MSIIDIILGRLERSETADASDASGRANMNRLMDAIHSARIPVLSHQPERSGEYCWKLGLGYSNMDDAEKIRLIMNLARWSGWKELTGQFPDDLGRFVLECAIPGGHSIARFFGNGLTILPNGKP